jgi:hypothetical protein
VCCMRAPRNPDWDELSPEGVWRVQRVALPLALGYTPNEIADSLGETPAWVSSNLAELRDELRQVGQQ